MSQDGHVKRENVIVALFERARQGDKEALCLLVYEYKPLIKQAILRRLKFELRPAFDASDVFQDIALNMHESAFDVAFSSPTALLAYLNKAAANQMIDLQRRQGRAKRDVNRETSIETLSPEDKDKLTTAEPAPEQVVATEDTWNRFLAQLPPFQRRLVVLRKVGFSIRECAIILKSEDAQIRYLLHVLLSRFSLKFA